MNNKQVHFVRKNKKHATVVDLRLSKYISSNASASLSVMHPSPRVGLLSSGHELTNSRINCCNAMMSALVKGILIF